MESKKEEDIHPLTLDVVVPVILRHVRSMKGLLVFRRVCRVWREFATPIITSRSLELSTINFKAYGEHFRQLNGSVELSLLGKYVDYLESDFHPKIIFSDFHFDSLWLDHPIVRRFLEGFGYSVKKLQLNKIDGGFYYDKTPLRTVQEGKESSVTFRSLLLSCSNLEELLLFSAEPGNEAKGFLLPGDDFKTKIKRVVWLQIPAYPKPYKPHHKFISDLLQVCPSLENFVNVEDVDRGFLKALSQSPYLSSLKELEHTNGNVKVYETLKDKLSLKKLKFREVKVLEGEGFRAFLDTQKDSLETLIVAEWGVYSNIQETEMPPIPFPDVMDKLKVLNIGEIHPKFNFGFDGPLEIHRQLPLQPLHFPRQFPNLKTLILRGHAKSYDLNKMFIPGMEPHMVLQGLELPWDIKREELALFAQLFPNVKELKLRDVDEDALRVLWGQWPQMESLFLYDVDNIETALTGLSAKKISIVDSLIKRNKGWLGNEINTKAEHPSTIGFQNLQELRILKGRENDKAKGFLTDVCIYHTLSKLPKLELLVVNTHKVSNRAIKHLCSVGELKWNKKFHWKVHCQKDLDKEYKTRPNCDEDWATRVPIWDEHD